MASINIYVQGGSHLGILTPSTWGAQDRRGHPYAQLET